MKNKKILLCSALVIGAALTFTVKMTTSAAEPVIKIQTEAKSPRTDAEKKLTDEKVKKMLDATYKDIKDSFKIDQSLYTEVKPEQLETLANGQLPGFEDKAFGKEASDKAFRSIIDAPKGSKMPLILIKNDKSEILVLYKEKDGTNTLKSLTKQDNAKVKSNSIESQNNSEKSNWNEREEKKPGIVIPSVQ